MADEERNESSTDSSNPFETELKSDFSSSFGATTTNAVSHMFKDSGFLSENRTKLIAILGVLVLLIAGGIYFLSETGPNNSNEFMIADTEDQDEEELTLEGLNEEIKAEEKEKKASPMDEEDDLLGDLEDEQDLAKESKSNQDFKDLTEDTDLASIGYGDEDITDTSTGDSTDSTSSMPTQKQVAASSPPVSQSPANGAQRIYNEASSRAKFIWDAGGGSSWITISPNQDLSTPVAKLHGTPSGSLEVRRLLTPGTWYWQVSNNQGKSEVRNFTILPAPLRKIDLIEPSLGSSLSASSGTVKWTGDTEVSLYKVEATANGDWTNPEFKRSTSATQITVAGIPTGNLQMRVGAFSEVSGQWEFTEPVDISVTE